MDFCTHINYIYVHVKFGVFSSYDFRETLFGHYRQMDMAKLIFLIALIKKYGVSHVSFDLFNTLCLNYYAIFSLFKRNRA